MNDLELVSEFRSHVGEPDGDTAARARAALMDTIAGAPPVRAPRRHGARRRPLLGLVGIAAAAGLAALAGLPGSGDGTPPAAAAVLKHTALIAAAQAPSAPPGPGQYVYTRSVGTNEVDTADAGPQHDQYFRVAYHDARQAWIATDGSGRLVESETDPHFVSAKDRRAWIASGRPSLRIAPSSERFGPGGLYYLDLTRLPTNPDKLRALIEQRKIEGGPPGDAETFVIIGDLLRETYAPPKLRAALFQVASQLPGIQLLGPTHWTGRRGVAVAYPGGGYLHELVFSPTTAALLGERTVQAHTGKVAAWTIYLESAVVGSTHSTH
jgi:hypothetical protein